MQKSSDSVLLTQSFIMAEAGSYWDYRDYIFSLCSNPVFKNTPVRLNVERGHEFVEELVTAAVSKGFTDCIVTKEAPASWSAYMLEQINNNTTTWTMPFPGDHIYIEDDDGSSFSDYLTRGAEMNVDAISFGHIQDWDYLLDWNRVHIVSDTPDYVIIDWGHKYRYCRNYQLSNKIQQAIGRFLMVPPVPGFMIFKSDFLCKILGALSHATRWQDMEYVEIDDTWSYRVLIPKKYLYRHVHGYWLEYAFEVLSGRQTVHRDPKDALDGMYIRTQHDWRQNMPTITEYRLMCLERSPLMRKYYNVHKTTIPGSHSPFFNPHFIIEKAVLKTVYNCILLYTIDLSKHVMRWFRKRYLAK